jgi:hypothetical protein
VPFPVATRVDPWLVPVIAELDGSYTVGELFDAVREAGMVPPRMTVDAFLGLVATLVERGYLELERHPLPQPHPRSGASPEARQC